MEARRPTYLCHTLGCKVNYYESQALSRALEEIGFVYAKKGERCDLVFINSCAVTAESVRKTKQITRRMHKQLPDAAIVLMGCAAQLCPGELADIEGVSYICGTRNKNALLSFCKDLLRQDTPYSEQPAVINVIPPEGQLEEMRIDSFDRTRAYVKIQDGCNGRCTYCIIPSLRGRVVSRPVSAIVSEVKALALGGCHEIVLTGIETSAYEYDLAALMRELDAIPGILRIRLGSLDPSFMKPEFVDRIADLKSVAPHFHLSLQSGSDRVLGRMKRRYRMETVYRNLRYLKERMPGVCFSTDVIVGFPGEDEEMFEQTLEAVRQIGFLHVHVFPYSKRPGTEAAEMTDQVEDEIKQSRAARLIALSKQEADKLLHQRTEDPTPLSVLVETKDKNGCYHGHDRAFYEVCFESDRPLKKGSVVFVKPLMTKDDLLYGCLIDPEASRWT